MSVRLSSVNGKWNYNVVLHVETNERKIMKVGGKYGLCIQNKAVGELHPAVVDGKFIVIQGKYEGEDPEELIRQAEVIVGKWKCGIQVRKPIDTSQRSST